MADRMSRVECVEERSIMVDWPSIPNGIDEEKIRDRLTIYFQRKANCGGDVAKVLYPIPSNSKRAIVVFVRIDLNSLLKKKPHVIHWTEGNNMHVEIRRLPQMFDTVKVDVNPFYLNLVPRDKTDDLSLGLKTNANAVLVHSTSMDDSTTINFPNIRCLESVRNVLAHVVGLQNKNTISNDEEIDKSSYVEDDTSCKQTSGCKQPSGRTQSQLEKTSTGTLNRENGVPTFEGASGHRVYSHQNTKEHMVREQARPLAPSFSNDPNKYIDKNNCRLDNAKSGGRNDVISAGHLPAHQKFQTSELVSVHRLLFHYLQVKHKQELDDICQKCKVTIKRLSESNHEGEVKIYFTSTSESTVELILQAHTRFVDLYQSIYQHVTLRPLAYNDINNQSNNQSTIDEAKLVISSKTPNVLVEDSVDGEVTFVGVEKEVEEAIKIFQTHTGLQHKSRKLRSHADNSQSKSLSDPVNTGGKDCDAGYQQDGACARPLYWQPVPSNFKEEVFLTAEGLEVIVQKGDITKQHVDVIVNASNTELIHGGGVAGALANVAGLEIQHDCNIIRRNRNAPLLDGECVYTGGYRLPCKHVIHAVGPTYNSHAVDGNRFFSKLQETFLNCFKQANTLEAKTIAIPLISSGIYGGPKELCAKALVGAIKQYSKQNKSKTTKQIALVNIDNQANDAILKTMNWLTMDDDNTMEIEDCSSNAVQQGGRNITTSFESSGDANHIRDKQPYDDTGEGRSKKLANQRDLDILPGGGNDNGSSEGNEEDKMCPICRDDFSDVKPALDIGRCKHKYCKECLDELLKRKPVCAICGHIYGVLKGNQPDGQMTVSESTGYITISYSFPGGTQGSSHPNPGRSYVGASRTAYLPNNPEGKRILALLKKAFAAKLIFTIGTSVTTGITDTITWNDIHHKTSMSGGAHNFGYPDPTYLQRVTEELAAKGIN